MTRLFGAALALGLLALPARGQEAGQFEFGLFGGVIFGTRLSISNLNPQTQGPLLRAVDPGNGDVRLGDGASFGLRGGYRVNPHFTLEGGWTHSSVTARTTVPETGSGTGPLLATTKPVTLDVYELTGLYEWGRGRARGYFGIGAGAMNLSDDGAGLPHMGTRFMASAVLGTRIRLADRLDFRLEGRYRFRVTPDRVSMVLCGEDGCKTFTTSFYTSPEIAAGISYRFGADPFKDVIESGMPGGRAPAESDKRFWAAAAGVAFFDVVPWAFNRYVADAEFAHISMETIRGTFRAGFGYDRDSFKTNQSSHPFHGSLFFNSARYNGYSFWESGIFTFMGSFIWEVGLEREPPAMNDLVNTTLGGMNRGEVLHRLATMLRDNKASGSTRFWREAGGLALDPAGGAYRLLRGEMKADFENPPDRDPKVFFLRIDAGYRHLGGDEANTDQFIGSMDLLYGDVFRGEFHKPFETFTVSADLAFPGGVAIPRYQQRGILKGWELTDESAPTRHVFGFVMDYEYVNNAAQVFGAQILGAGLFSRHAFSDTVALRTDFSAGVFPLAGIGTTDVLNPISGRNFDYAPGGGARAGVRLLVKGYDVVNLSYAVGWASTVDGSTSSNTLQSFRGTGRWAFGKHFGVGGNWSWYERLSRYSFGLETVLHQIEWRFFLSWRLL